ncbi:hypothetical protein SMSP2_01292 [Limihaloglobus sulfuriphilus]|uniref:Uncharacterized protein n=1 Tax=Limihaloglobus sulfuriphilus TaxID=1851148 RepID=A0A1Q2MEF6_9BACT|nr:hypothetical protein [Limihaloglobus sulfuriphilus]AQQ70928.1 hypothetical protein SMSP2_01292 [Limihaloglobus sulfuriphilus]
MTRYIVFLYFAAAYNVCYAELLTLASQTGDSVEITMPAVLEAYKYVDIPYSIQGIGGPVVVEATAFEQSSKLAGRALYDCAVPGNLSADVRLLKVTGADFSEAKVNGGVYPPIVVGNYGISSVIPKKYMTHFTFLVENTGDTIWDAEGYGQIRLTLNLVAADGTPYNEETINYPMDYVYPGEYFEITLPVFTYRVPYGSYTANMDIIYCGQEITQDRFIGNGILMTRCSFGFTLSTTLPGMPSPISATVENYADQRNFYAVSKHEELDEFLTSYRICTPATAVSGNMRLMAAPWTESVTLKYITANEIITQTVDVQIDDSFTDFEFNPENPWTVLKDGRPFPALMPKSMPCIRESYYSGINADENITAWLVKAKDVGARAMGMMSYNWALWGFRDRVYNPSNRSTFFWGPSLEYYYKECRRLGMKVLWWGSYEFQNEAYDEVAALKLDDNRYGDWVSRSDPDLITGIGCYIDWAIDNYGDVMYRTADGRLPIVYDFGNGMAWHGVGRRWLGASTQKVFIERMREKYVSIQTLNDAWGWNYADFTDIDAEPSLPDQRRMFYNETTAPFIPGTAAMKDLDDFRADFWADFMIAIRNELQKRHPEIIVGYLDESHQLFGLEGDPAGDVVDRIINEFNKIHAVEPSVLASRRPVDFIGNYNVYAYDRFDLLEQALVNTKSLGIDSFYQPCADTGQIFNDPTGPVSWHGLVATGEPFRVSGYNIKRVLVPLYPHFKLHYQNNSPCAAGWTDFHSQRITNTQVKEMKAFMDKAQEVISPVPQQEIDNAMPRVSAYALEQIERAAQTVPKVDVWFHGGTFNRRGTVELRASVTNFSGSALNDITVAIRAPHGWDCTQIEPSGAICIESGARTLFRYELYAYPAVKDNKSYNGERVEITAIASSNGQSVASGVLVRPLYWDIECGSDIRSDINCDGILDYQDLSYIIQNWLYDGLSL